MIQKIQKILFLTILAVLLTQSASAQEFSSTNYSVSNPVIFPGGYGTSASFGLTSVISQMAIGTSSSSSFKGFGGFLYFPFVSTPSVGATAAITTRRRPRKRRPVMGTPNPAELNRLRIIRARMRDAPALRPLFHNFPRRH